MSFNEHLTANETPEKEIAFMALGYHFPNRHSFDIFYESLYDPKIKNDFHRVTNFYLFLVKSGDWQIAVNGYDPIIDYFTNSFKLVALFSLIESLTDLKHQDFYQWLSTSDQQNVFPISDRSDLDRLYGEYKKTHGSIRRCVDFFKSLPDKHKITLCNSIHIDGVPIDSIEKLAQFLYKLRSEFVHEAQLVLHVNNSTVYHLKNKRMDCSSLSLDKLLEAFEEGVISYFRERT